MDTFLGMAFFICIGVVIFGIVKGFDWPARKSDQRVLLAQIFGSSKSFEK